ncbi:DUF1254 domain-containing protein [Paenibacillus chibensis]|uniref:DUF1254 domain-containing protein n=1 Tax=Paenibacillus chibensis TaxID=59846 RepID=UPI000FDBEBC0|nr:DUF1254 domain-containing protein [Paenibacillus chibensis]MEC0369004.1 DUF1254 domain-containing protein [Paenibacillus chibensis]
MHWRTWKCTRLGKGLLAAVLACGTVSGGSQSAYAVSGAEGRGLESMVEQFHPPQTLTGKGASELEQLAYSLGVQAYLYGYPLLVMEQTEAEMLKSRAPINRFYYSDTLASPAYRDIVTPNSSTLYFSAWLDLSKGPVMLNVPANPSGRYYTVQMLDAYTNTFHNVSNRSMKNKRGRVEIAGPSWYWKTAHPKIVAPTNTVWLLGRVEVDGKQDEGRAASFEKQFTLKPLHGHKELQGMKKLSAVPVPDLTKQPLAFYQAMTDAIKRNPPPPGDQVLLDQFKLFGIDPAQGFDAKALNPAVVAGLVRAAPEAQRIIEAAGSWVPKANGWAVGYGIGTYGDRFLERAVVAYSGLGANVPSEELYARADADGSGMPLTGKHNYVLHFGKEQLPAATGFWSLTMYGPDMFLVPNSLQRYAIGDLTEGMKYNADGSLDIYIRHAPPEGNMSSNWLPAPEGGFHLVLRVFAPKPEMLDKRYAVPPVQRQS